MERQPTSSLLLILSILERIIYDDSEVLTGCLFSLKGVKVSGGDEDNALLIAWCVSVRMYCTGRGRGGECTLGLVEEGDGIVFLRLLAEVLLPLDGDFVLSQGVGRDVDGIAFFDNAHFEGLGGEIMVGCVWLGMCSSVGSLWIGLEREIMREGLRYLCYFLPSTFLSQVTAGSRTIYLIA